MVFLWLCSTTPFRLQIAGLQRQHLMLPVQEAQGFSELLGAPNVVAVRGCKAAPNRLGNPWENHGKTMGKWWFNWENHGKTIGKWWFDVIWWVKYPPVSSNMAGWKMDHLSMIFSLLKTPFRWDFPASHVTDATRGSAGTNTTVVGCQEPWSLHVEKVATIWPSQVDVWYLWTANIGGQQTGSPWSWSGCEPCPFQDPWSFYSGIQPPGGMRAVFDCGPPFSKAPKVPKG